MKKLFLYPVVLLGVCFLASCGSDEKTESNLSVENAPGIVAATGGEVSFDVKSNVSWTVAKPASAAFITSINPSSGTNDGSVKVTVAPNTTAGSYTATLTVAGDGLTRSVVISQYGVSSLTATPSISGASSNACPSLEAALTCTTVEGANSYQWFKNAQTISGATSTAYTVTATGTYTVAGVNAGGPGAQSAAKEVTINSCPPAQAAIEGASSNTCPAVAVELTATADDATSFQWYNAAGAISGATASTYSVTATGTYTVAGVNAAGTGAASAAKVVTIVSCLPLQATIAGASSNTCPDKTVVLTATAGGATSFQWYNATGAISGATASTYSVATTGAYTVAGVSISGTGPMSAAKTVTIAGCPPAKATISGSTVTTCNNDNVVMPTLTATAEGATSYTWYQIDFPTPGTTMDVTAFLSSTATPHQLKPLAAGTYVVEGKNAAGTGARSDVFVLKEAPCKIPTLLALDATTVPCPMTAPVAMTIVSEIPTGVSYQWYKNGVAIGATNNEPLMTFSEPGTYTCRYSGSPAGTTNSPLLGPVSNAIVITCK